MSFRPVSPSLPPTPGSGQSLRRALEVGGWFDDLFGGKKESQVKLAKQKEREEAKGRRLQSKDSRTLRDAILHASYTKTARFFLMYEKSTSSWNLGIWTMQAPKISPMQMAVLVAYAKTTQDWRNWVLKKRSINVDPTGYWEAAGFFFKVVSSSENRITFRFSTEKQDVAHQTDEPHMYRMIKRQT